MDSPPFKVRMTARDVIDDIREELGVGEGILQEIASNKRIQRVFSNQQSLTQNAVRELSTGLYQEDTHFILELIQNADDNRYEDYIEPTIAFTVTPGFIRVDCNECGFSERDVRAICHLGKSTKKAKKVEGYIGEKGIGFKSVFKVAQKVYIKSADYTFKFDTTLPELGPTGMVAPTWSSFPDAETVPKHTQMLLELLPNYDAGELEEKLEALQRTLLLFLRRLRRIEINTSKGSRVFTRQDEPNDSKVFLREGINSPLMLVPSVSTLEYLLISHVLDTLPAEPKRSGINSTQILLAFPVQDSSATATKQLVYAFLPVKHFGFNFLIQADFLLSSSREDIQECAWNRCLRAGIKEAFSEAVGKFNTVPLLMYTWPRYLSTSTYSGTYLSELATQGGPIAKELSHHHILWSRADTLQAPAALTRIPELYMDRHSNPLLGSKQHYQYQLSPKYSATDVLKTLALLGDLCGVLNQSYWIKQSPKKIGKIPLIPLRDGSWASAASIDSSPIYFQHEELYIPFGVQIRVVDPRSSKNRERKAIFELLGVKLCDHEDVCQAIVEAHRIGKADTLAVDELLSHAIYLYYFRDRCRDIDLSYVRLLDSTSSAACGSELYFESPNAGATSAGALLKSKSNAVRFIHGAYMQRLPNSIDQHKWMQWLMHELQLSDIPRIKEKGRNSLSPAFLSIIASSPSWVLLKLLTDNWQRYSLQMTNEIREELSHTLVKCGNNENRPLRDTILPLPQLTKLSNDYGISDLPFLSIGDLDIDSSSLPCLRALGVTIRDDVDIYVSILKALSSRRKRMDVDEVRRIYQRILTTCVNFEALRAVFDGFPLVFIPSHNPDGHRWLQLRDCFWRALPYIRSKVALSPHYPGLQELFYTKLHVGNATMSLLVDDLISTTKSVLSANGIIKLKEMVVGLANFVKNTPKQVMQEQLLRLRETAYLPVCEQGVKNLTLMLSTDKFFIADRKELSEAFTKDLPILDFSVDEVRYMRPLIDALDIKKKYLLDSVLETYEMGGIFTTDEVLTSSLRNKSHTLFSCALHYESLKAKGEDSVLAKQLSKLVVTRVEKFQLVRRVASQGFNKVKFFPAQIHFRETVGNISVFLPLVGEEINAILGFLLPRLLVQWLQITKDKAESVFSNVLLQSGATLSRVLEEEDISLTAIEDYDVGVDDSELGPLKPKAESPIAELQAQPTVSNPNEIQISLHMHSKTKVNGAGKSLNQPTNSTDQTLNSPDVDDDFGPRTPFVARTGPPKRFRVQNSSCVGQESSLPDSGDDDYDIGPTSRAFHLAFPHLHNRMETLIKAAANQTPGGADIVSSKIAPIGTKAQELTSLVVERPDIKQIQRKRPLKGRLVNGGHNSTKRQKDEAQYVANLGTGFQGEIFAVDMLRGQLNQSDGQFDPEKHWTSSLRSWAKVYDHHKHLTAYTAPEISDITYHDRNGSLSKWLVANGCTRARKWLEASPTYHIEVKSTTGGCDEAFSMSSHQLELAQQMAAIDKLAPEKVYIIIRVYNVYHEPAFRLYVDPWSLIQDGTLSLTPDEYLVRVSL